MTAEELPDEVWETTVPESVLGFCAEGEIVDLLEHAVIVLREIDGLAEGLRPIDGYGVVDLEPVALRVVEVDARGVAVGDFRCDVDAFFDEGDSELAEGLDAVHVERHLLDLWRSVESLASGGEEQFVVLIFGVRG